MAPAVLYHDPTVAILIQRVLTGQVTLYDVRGDMAQAGLLERSSDERAHGAAVIDNESVKCHSIPPCTW